MVNKFTYKIGLYFDPSGRVTSLGWGPYLLVKRPLVHAELRCIPIALWKVRIVGSANTVVEIPMERRNFISVDSKFALIFSFPTVQSYGLTSHTSDLIGKL